MTLSDTDAQRRAWLIAGSLAGVWPWAVAQTGKPIRLVVPAGTPAAVVARLNAEINQALALPELARQLAVEGAVPTPTTPAAFAALIQREIPRWAAVVKAGNVNPD